MFEPLELAAHAVLVPAPRVNLVKINGVLGSAAKWRAAIIPGLLESDACNCRELPDWNRPRIDLKGTRPSGCRRRVLTWGSRRLNADKRADFAAIGRISKKEDEKRHSNRHQVSRKKTEIRGTAGGIRVSLSGSIFYRGSLYETGRRRGLPGTSATDNDRLAF